MKEAKILIQLSTESIKEFEKRIENFINSGWEVRGLSKSASGYYYEVLLVTV